MAHLTSRLRLGEEGLPPLARAAEQMSGRGQAWSLRATMVEIVIPSSPRA